MIPNRSQRRTGHGSLRARRSASNTTVLVASDWAPIRVFDPIIRRNPESVYGDMLPVLRKPDLRIVNCECALTSARTAVWKSGSVFKGEPEHIAGLAVVPFEIACLANNHVFDYGVAGFTESSTILRKNGLKIVGAGMTEREAFAPLNVTIEKTRISIVNFSEGEDLTASRGGPGVCGWDLPRIAALVHRSKTAGACVIAIGHCGLEYVPFPPPYVVAAFRMLVDAGADCVIGHHPHVPQGIEWYHGRPIAYSLGNFVFYQNTDLYYRKTGFFLTLQLAGGSVAGIELHPYRITENGLRRLDSREERHFHQKMRLISTPLSKPAGAEKAWQAYLAYYGMQGFREEVLGIMQKMESDPEKAAAMFRNRITTMQHVELWRDFLTRVVDGQRQSFSREAYKVVEEWFTKSGSQESGVRRKTK